MRREGVLAAMPDDAPTTAPVRAGGRHRYAAVLVLALGVAVFSLLASDGPAARALELVTAGATLVVAVLTSRASEETRRRGGATLAVAVVVAGVFVAAGVAHPAIAYAIIAGLLVATAFVIFAGLIRLVTQRGVVLQAVFGALAVYILVGLTFGFLIGAFATASPGDYFAQGTDATQNTRVYFSFTALTTTGFGDYTAANRGGRALAVLEMLIGQLYLVTVIATLVGNLRRPSS